MTLSQDQHLTQPGESNARAMVEAELKITLEPGTEARLRRHPALSAMRVAPRRIVTLRATYYDTAGQALAAAGIALRVRKEGRRWVQTVKRRTGGSGGGGFFANLEIERPAPGGRLALEGPDPEGIYAAIAAIAASAPLEPVFETRVRRLVERLEAPGGGLVELAIDRGEIVAGAARAPIREVELELLEGEVPAIYAVARALFQFGPVKFSRANKAERGRALARIGEADAPPRPRTAGRFAHDGTQPVETAARDVLRDCYAQIAANLEIVATSDDSEGAHQLRVGLRRLRSAIAVFGESLGAEALAPLAHEARRLGQVVAGLRDADVLIDEVVAAAAARGLDPEARAALTRALEKPRAARRGEVRAALAETETVGFVFDLGAMIEGRGWLAPPDRAQAARLAAPLAEVAPVILDKRARKVRRKGRRLGSLDDEALHDLRKDLKKLRYAVEMLGPIYSGKRVARYRRRLKGLQDTFGSLNDAAMARDALAGAGAPTAAAAQRGVGWVLGALAVQAEVDRARLHARWSKLQKAAPFWR